VDSRIAKALLAALVAATAATAFVSAQQAAVPASPQPRSGGGGFSLGVLRRDGFLLPFASFDGRAWDVTWPGTDISAPLPISLSDVPKRWWGAAGADAPWHAWFPEAPARPLKLAKPVQVPVFCGAYLAVGTDYRGEAPTEREPTAPKDALAIAGDVTPLPITRLSLFAEDSTRMVAAITEKFNEEEAIAVSQFVRWWHPWGARSRAQFPITLEAFYRATDSSVRGQFRTSYIEAVRKFPARPGDEGCGLITYVRGWVTEYGDKPPLLNLGARVAYCDRAEVSFLQPFGRIVMEQGRRGGAGANVYWVYQVSSWRDEVYTVAHVSPEGVRPVLVAAGGGCPKEPPKR
jgi:hypothetical protein